MGLDTSKCSPSTDEFEDDKLRGCLFGVAVGDALGTPLEFQKRDCGVTITKMQGGGPHHLPPGFWTDDTTMALCLAESLILKNGFDQKDQMRRWLSWYENGHLGSDGTCFDIGMTTHKHLQRFKDDPSVEFKENPQNELSGNGSLMRLAPVPLFFRKSVEDAVKFSGLSSVTTHTSPYAVSSVKYYAALIVGALKGDSKDNILSPMYIPPGAPATLWKTHALNEKVLAIAKGSYKEKTRDQISSSGFVLHTLEAALWAFHKTDSFRDGALLAANLADDSDTVCAIYGALAGAYYGYDAIPREWLQVLAQRSVVELLADALIQLPRTGELPDGFEQDHALVVNAEDLYRSLIYSRTKPSPRRFKSLAEFDAAAADFKLKAFGAEPAGFGAALCRDYEQLLAVHRAVVKGVVDKLKLGAGGMFAQLKAGGKKKKKKKSGSKKKKKGPKPA